MKKQTLLYVALGVLTLGIVYLLYTRGKGTSGGTNPVAPPIGGNTKCLKVPTTFPAYSGEDLPAGTKAFLGISDADWTLPFQSRVRGFWKAVNVQPTDERAAYFGKQAILDYLATDTGRLPVGDVALNSFRCEAVAGLTYQLF